VKILNGTYNESNPLARELGLIRCNVDDYCVHSDFDTTLYFRYVNSSWYWTPLDPTYIHRNRYWLPITVTQYPEKYPFHASTSPTEPSVFLLKEIAAGKALTRPANNTVIGYYVSHFNRTAIHIDDGKQPKPGTGVIETDPNDKIARALKLSFWHGEFYDKKCSEDVLCDPIWYRKEFNRWWWTPYPPTHKHRMWLSTNVVRVPNNAPKPWAGKVPPDMDVKYIRMFAAASIAKNIDAKPVAPAAPKPPTNAGAVLEDD
jgi:hypothetical protein